MQIRSATIEDLRRVSYITKLAWKKPYKKGGVVNGFSERVDLVDQIGKKKLFILVAVLDSRIVGAVRYELVTKKEIYFSKLVTLPSFRGKGIGAALVKRLESLAKRKKIEKISLDVMEEKFLEPYYANLGYKALKRVAYPTHHEVRMVKKIP